jgi:DNA-binding IscR family transcriptional regulator
MGLCYWSDTINMGGTMLNNKLQLAIAILREINKRPGINTDKIAQNVEAHRSYVEQILQPLSKSGYVRGKRGPGGGYTMLTEFNDIKIYTLGHRIGCRTRIKIGRKARALPITIL